MNDTKNSPRADSSPSEVIARIGKEKSLNEKQYLAFRIISDNFVKRHIERRHDVDQLVMLMTGPGGTGKTHVVKALNSVMMHYGCGHMIRYLAPTGSAAALIDGMTIHKGLGIKIKATNKGKGNRLPGESQEDYTVLISVANRTNLRDEWKNVEYVLLDEASLVGLELLADVDHALRFAKEKPDLWFGGVTVIFAGDFFQYPPVGGSPLYTPISPYAGTSDAEIRKRLGRLAWKTVNTIVNLTEQQRMKDDPEYGDAVCRLRTRECTIDDVDLFNSRVIRSPSWPNGVDMSTDGNFDATAIVARNNLREVLNHHKASVAHGFQPIVHCLALDKCTHYALTLPEREVLLRLNVSSFPQSLPGTIPLYVGMPVILRLRNLSTDLGITNGSQGIVQKIFSSTCPLGLRYATCIYVEFPHSKVKLDGLPPTYFIITPVKWMFTTLLKRHDGSQTKVRICRLQLPIQPAFAVTGHSAQGKTLPKVLVNLSEGGFGAYVAASRARTRAGLCLTEPVTLERLNKPIPADLYVEVERHKVLEHNTYIRHGLRSGTLKDVPDPEAERGDKRVLKVKFNDDSAGTDVDNDDKQNKRKREVTEATICAEVGSLDLQMCADLSDQPKLNKKVKIFGSKQSSPVVQERLRLVTPVSLSPPSTGCRWSATDWSCSYDVVFTSLFHVYRASDRDLKQRWITLSDHAKHLAESFDFLSMNHTDLFSQNSFETCRDRFRDKLSGLYPRSFPRRGQVPASACLMLEYVFPSSTRRLISDFSCASNSCPGNNLDTSCDDDTLTIPIITASLRGLSSFNPVFRSQGPSLQEWLDIYLQTTNARDLRLGSQLHTSSQCEGTVSRDSACLVAPPPVLFFERILHLKIEPSREFQVPSTCGVARYSLKAIIYLGDNHFSARFCAEGKIWNYDGQVNGGVPYMEPTLSDVDLCMQLHFAQRDAHLLIYALSARLPSPL